MLSWLFKKSRGNRVSEVANTSASKSGNKSAVPDPAIAAAEKARGRAEAKALALAQWTPLLQSALGDDAALLRVATESSLTEIKLAAVEALSSEAALRQAEREFRSHDRRVHQVARRRLDATVGQRQARACADALIETALALDGMPLLPVNHLVALDRAWQALDASLLESTQIAQFTALSEQLNSTLRERADLEQRLRRWGQQAEQAVAEAQPSLIQTAGVGLSDDFETGLRAVRQQLQSLSGDCPDATAGAVQLRSIAETLQAAASLVERLNCLRTLDAKQTAPASQALAELSSVDLTPEVPASDADMALTTPLVQSASPAERWRALPAMADGALKRLLDQRFDEWQKGRAPKPERKPRVLKPMPAVSDAAAAPDQRVAKQATAEQRQGIIELLDVAETAVAAGQLSEMQQHLDVIDAALKGLHGAALDDALRSRLQGLQAERTRLRAWEKWSGAQALDALIAEAEELARQTMAAMDVAEPLLRTEDSERSDAAPGAADVPTLVGEAEPAVEVVADPVAVVAGRSVVPKLHIQSHRQAIQKLRERWKLLDQAAGNHALWQRFDAALRLAYQPVAAQQAELNAIRLANLQAREALLDGLDGLPDAAAATDEVLDQSAALKERVRVLAKFQLDWRQLGPIEHTVPSQARVALQQRLQAALDRIEVPLQQARRAAEGQREQLILRAEVIVQEVLRNPQARDVAPRVRELQAQWQQHARSLPLARPVETALWKRFKTATDAVFAQREAAFNARDAEFSASLQAHEGLLEQLSSLAAEAPAQDIQRRLHEIERAWRDAGELSRAAVQGIESRYREGRAAVQRRLDQMAAERWLLQCDALVAKLSLCEQREAGSHADADADLALRWAAIEALPTAWELALAQRWAGRADAILNLDAVDDLLLQLEAALDLPATVEQQAARRNLKLRALKSALEGGGQGRSAPPRPSECLAPLLRQVSISSDQRSRLERVIQGLRQAPNALF